MKKPCRKSQAQVCREVRGSQGTGVVSNNWLDRVLLSILYTFEPSCWPMLKPHLLGPLWFPFNSGPQFLGSLISNEFAFPKRRTWPGAGQRSDSSWPTISLSLSLSIPLSLSLSLSIYIYIYIHTLLNYSIYVYNVYNEGILIDAAEMFCIELGVERSATVRTPRAVRHYMVLHRRMFVGLVRDIPRNHPCGGKALHGFTSRFGARRPSRTRERLGGRLAALLCRRLRCLAHGSWGA